MSVLVANVGVTALVFMMRFIRMLALRRATLPPRRPIVIVYCLWRSTRGVVGYVTMPATPSRAYASLAMHTLLLRGN